MQLIILVRAHIYMWYRITYYSGRLTYSYYAVQQALFLERDVSSSTPPITPVKNLPSFFMGIHAELVTLIFYFRHYKHPIYFIYASSFFHGEDVPQCFTTEDAAYLCFFYCTLSLTEYYLGSIVTTFIRYGSYLTFYLIRYRTRVFSSSSTSYSGRCIMQYHIIFYAMSIEFALNGSH